MDCPEAPCITMGASTLPYDFVSKAPWPKDGVHYDFQVVTRAWVAVQVKASCWFQDAMQFNQPLCHHDHVCGQGSAPDKLNHRLQHLPHAVGCMQFHVVKCPVGGPLIAILYPIPGVGECLYLRC